MNFFELIFFSFTYWINITRGISQLSANFYYFKFWIRSLAFRNVKCKMIGGFEIECCWVWKYNRNELRGKEKAFSLPACLHVIDFFLNLYKNFFNSLFIILFSLCHSLDNVAFNKTKKSEIFSARIKNPEFSSKIVHYGHVS